MNPSAQLAIIIPAYKTKFLRAALDSVAAQTDKNFQLYVFDDCSPEPVADIVREYADRLPLKFHRFDENLGGTSLVKHWERCIRLTGEPWVWLFADDDVMEAGCVADFYAELKRTGAAHDLYRFNTVWIDGNGAKIQDCPKHPPSESGAEYLLARLDRGQISNMQEIIFLRSAWEAVGGILDLPLAWHSDDAFIASMGVRKPLCAIPGAQLRWRYSGANISSSASFRLANRKIMAYTEFFPWVASYFEKHAPAKKDSALWLAEAWLLNFLRTCWQFVGWKTCFALDRLARDVWHRPRGWGLATGVWMNLTLIVKKVAGRLGRRTAPDLKNNI